MNIDGNNIARLYESVSKVRISKIVIINGSKLLLLQKHGNLKWELPGGHVDPNERMKEGAIREVYEETNNKLDINHLDKIYSNTASDLKLNIYSYTRPLSKKVKISDEHVNYRWVTREEIDELELTNNTNHLVLISAFPK